MYCWFFNITFSYLLFSVVGWMYIQGTFRYWEGEVSQLWRELGDTDQRATIASHLFRSYFSSLCGLDSRWFLLAIVIIIIIFQQDIYHLARSYPTDLFLAVLFQVGTDTVLRTRFSLLSWLYRLLPLSSLSGITSMALHILSVLVKMNLFHLSSMGQNNQYQNLLLGSLNQPAIQQRKPIIGTISFLLYPSNLSGFCISPLSWCPKWQSNRGWNMEILILQTPPKWTRIWR